MSKWIKNVSGVTKTYQGKDIFDAAYREITTDELKWANDSELLTDIGSGAVIIAKDDSGTTDITDVSTAINYLKDDLPTNVNIASQEALSQPFASKVLPDGRKLFRRKHGSFLTVPPNTNEELSLVMPYPAAKFNKVEIVGGKEGDYIDLIVYDSLVGIVQQAMGVPAESVTPNLLLNQFGFSVCIGSGVYSDESSYDADLYQDMEISLVYYNTSDSAITVGVNWTLHELV